MTQRISPPKNLTAVRAGGEALFDYFRQVQNSISDHHAAIRAIAVSIDMPVRDVEKMLNKHVEELENSHGAIRSLGCVCSAPSAMGLKP